MNADSRTLAPRELAERSGVSTDTLRHYERKGLLARPPRTESGYRRYPAKALARVLLIRRALLAGISLDELARALRARERGEAPCRRVRALVGDRLEAVDREIASLTALRKELRSLLRDWDSRLARTAPGRPARLLETLPARALEPPPLRSGLRLRGGSCLGRKPGLYSPHDDARRSRTRNDDLG